MKSLIIRQRTIFRTHKCRSNLQCLSKEGWSAVLKYIKESLQDLFIASALPFLIIFYNREINGMDEERRINYKICIFIHPSSFIIHNYL